MVYILTMALATTAFAGCGSGARTSEEVVPETAGNSEAGVNAASAAQAAQTDATGGNSAEVDARIIADAYMLYHVNGIEKAYDAQAYAAMFPTDYRKWYEEYFSGPIEDIAVNIEATFSEKGEFLLEESNAPADIYSSKNIDVFVQELSGEDLNKLSDPWRDLRKMMNNWTVKQAFRFVYTTKLTDGKKCEAEFHVLKLGGRWYVDVRNLQGPTITKL